MEIEALRQGDFRRCVIIAGAPDAYLDGITPTDFIIACDHGYDHARKAGIVPHLIVGDFDSMENAIPRDIPVFTVKAEKDDTDTALAARKGLELGFRDFLLLCALGGRIDHQMANFSVAADIAYAGGNCVLTDARHTIYTLRDGALKLRRQEGAFVSVFSFSDASEGVTLAGLKYPLTKVTLKNSVTLGVSNEFIQEEASISVDSGLLLVVVATEQS